MAHNIYRPGLEIATTFFIEVLDEFESVQDISDYLGHETIFDLTNLQNALLSGSIIELTDQDAGLLQVIDRLPGKEHYLKYVSTELIGKSKEKDPEPAANWERNDIQFPRLLAEIAATQDNLDMAALSESMNLEIDDINEIFDRAHDAWEEIKKATFKAPGPRN